MEKTEETLQLSEEILTDIESNKIFIEQIVYKCLRLARLINDFESIKRFNLEIHWYNYDKTIPWILNTEHFPIWFNHWRWILSEDEKGVKVQKIRMTSITELETNISSNNIKLEKLTLPSSYQPATSSIQTEWYYSNVPLKNEFVQEKFQDVIKKIRQEQDTIHNLISQNKDILSRVRNSIYNYVLSINYKIKYSETAQNLFEWRQKVIFQKLGTDINYNEIISSINHDLLSDNSNDWAGAVHNCRRLLKQMADNISPVNPKKTEIIKWSWKDKKTIKLWDDNYINRLMVYIDWKSKSEKFKEIVWSHLGYIWERLDSIYEASSKWTHAKVLKSEAERYIIFTYLLIADILEL